MTVTLVRPDGVDRVDVPRQVATTRGSRTVSPAGRVSRDVVEVDAVAVLPPRSVS